jgi:predicted nucleic acid-binding Zn ribbon protein
VGISEHLASILGYHPYRCRQCGHRFRVLGHPEPQAASPAVRGVEREITHTRSALRRRAVRRGIVLYGAALIVFAIILYYLTREPSMGG